MIIRALKSVDWPDVSEIYQLGIDTGKATFENQTPSWEDWDGSHLQFARLVAILDNSLLGWVALSPVTDRCVYNGVAEVSIYIHPKVRRKGIGKKLLVEVIEESEKNGIWTLNASIFPENVGSRILFEKAGFREIGFRERIARKNGVWKDNVILEKRSRSVKFA